MLLNKIIELSNKFEKLAMDHQSLELKNSEVDSYVESDLYSNVARYSIQFELTNGDKYQGKVEKMDIEDPNSECEVVELFKIKPGKDFIPFVDWKRNVGSLKKSIENKVLKKHLNKRFPNLPDLSISSNLEEIPDVDKYVIEGIAKKIVNDCPKIRHKKSISHRKEIFNLVSQGGLFDTAIDAASGIAGGIGKGIMDLGEKAYKGVTDLFTSKKEEDKKEKEEKEEVKREEKPALPKDDSLFNQIVGNFSKTQQESQKARAENPPPDSLRNILSGYTRTTSVPDYVVSKINEYKLLNQPYWSTKSIVYNGVWYIALVEWHYDDHTPGGTHWHKGISVFKPMSGSGEDRGSNISEQSSSSETLENKVDLEHLEDLHISPEFVSESPLNAQVLSSAIQDIGVKETGKNSGPEIEKYFQSIGITLPKGKGEEWCAAACSSWLKDSGFSIKGSASALGLANQFKELGLFVPSNAVEDKHLVPGNVVFWSRGGGKGHVGVLLESDGSQIKTVDGNSGRTGTEVAIMNRPRSGSGGLQFYGIGALNPESM